VTNASKSAKFDFYVLLLSIVLQIHLSSGRYAPRLQWQCLNPHNRRLDIAPEGDYTNDNAQDVDNVVPIPGDLVYATAVAASVLIRLAYTRESLCDRCAFEKGFFGGVSGREAGSRSEHVDGFEDEEARESATKIRYAEARLANLIVENLVKNLRSKKSHVGSADDRIRNLRMKCTDCNEHDCIHERRQHMLSDHEQ
jgi:hypothetical protein